MWTERRIRTPRLSSPLSYCHHSLSHSHQALLPLFLDCYPSPPILMHRSILLCLLDGQRETAMILHPPPSPLCLSHQDRCRDWVALYPPFLRWKLHGEGTLYPYVYCEAVHFVGRQLLPERVIVCSGFHWIVSIYKLHVWKWVTLIAVDLNNT